MTTFLHLTEETLALTVPRARFSDTIIKDCHASLRSTNLGTVLVSPWTKARIAGYERDYARWDRLGRHVAPLVARLDVALGARPRALRFVAWLRRVLSTAKPGDRTCQVEAIYVDGRGWLDNGLVAASAPGDAS